METYKGLLSVALLVALAVSALAAPVVVPKGTVIPVTMDKALSSATSQAGSTFYAHHNGINGAGFPENTEFTGNVKSVTKASGKDAGQIDVRFVGATLPGGTQMPIQGQLISLDDKSVKIDQASGRLVGTAGARKNPAKFIAIGAGAGLIIGQLAGKHAAIGGLIGAVAGYFYNQKIAKPAPGKDVLVPAGTRFGILLAEDATIPDAWSAASTAAIPADSGWQVTFKNLRPVVRGNDLLVPFRSVMDSIQMPFDYDLATRQVRFNYYESQAVHTIGTRIINVNGTDITMGAASRIINGSVYVPASYIELLTNKTAYWNQKSGVLRIV